MATRIPISKESFGFEDRQKKIWEEMESEMDRRRREWEEEIEKMRKEFFMLRPESDDSRTAGLAEGGPVSPLGLGGERVVRSRLLDNSANDDSRGAVVKDEQGNPVFKVLFDVHDYRPEEVTVKMDANKILVNAKHEEIVSGSSVSREYSRTVNLPHEVDPMTLQCTLGPDGILSVEAPLPVPKYSAIKDFTAQAVKVAAPASSPASQPQQQPTYQSTTSVFPSGPRGAANPPADPVYKPVLTSFQNSAPSPSPPLSSAQQATSASSFQTSSVRDVSGGVPGYSKVNPPFQAYSSPSYSPPAPKPASGARSCSPVMSVDKDGRFKLEVEIEDFRPEELTVKTQDQRVVVCARREEKSGNRTSCRELSREYTLPDTVDPLTIKAFFTDGGKLIVEAPFKEGAGQSVRSQVTGR